ncbi:peptidylprolyl isomerase [Erythrobacter sp.]|jgi:peptidyl-prolyl cis-trans isomerase D|uniref:peptidylprolyl isomerase n=1 Tax=Erythrobacter sp. TaxID=1042 RepID=UPI002ECA147B|nr:SurA N-terminal domain-containing protein [Erythrobacter sp.]
MISLFRNFFQSKIGLPIFIGFLIIVALAFAASDISGSATFGGLSGDDKVAVVGDQAITSNEMNAAMNNALDRARQQNPTITMPQFVAAGGLERELDLLIDRYAVGLFAQKYGLRAGDNLINSEILQIGAFRNLTGEFDQATYQAALQQQGITDAMLRRDIADGLLAQQILRPALAALSLPRAAARQYAALVTERREGAIGVVPSALYAPEGDPTRAQLQGFYDENRARYILPERRALRFARFGVDAVPPVPAPSEAQIAARYRRDAAQYAAQDRRAITSFVVPTREAAQALVQRVRGGMSLEAAAREAGFNVSSGEPRGREELASATSAALAEAVFAAEEGDILDPARSTLGFYVARVDEIERTPARELSAVRSEIVQQLEDEARAAALAQLSSEIEELVDTGSSLGDVAEAYGLEVETITGLTADGRRFGVPGSALSPTLQPVVDVAFQMEESEPQLAEIVPGEQFLVFDVADIVASAAPPLAEIRDEVIEAWRLEQGSEEAREVANRVLEQVRAGTPLAEAMRSENAQLDEVDQISLSRRALIEGGQRIPAPLVLMFSMAQGSTKLLEGEGNVGWFLVDLDTIATDPIADDDPLLAQTREQIGGAMTGEYASQLSAAIREEVGAERNAEAIEALRRTLAGES